VIRAAAFKAGLIGSTISRAEVARFNHRKNRQNIVKNDGDNTDKKTKGKNMSVARSALVRAAAS
jgi:hypothetical protein